MGAVAGQTELRPRVKEKKSEYNFLEIK